MNIRSRSVKNLEDTKIIRKKILNIAFQSGEGHIASCFSIVEIIYSLFEYILDLTKDGSYKEDKDLFILSKGHASLVLYVLLEKVGIIPYSTLESFATKGSILGGHPDRLTTPGIEVSTGSLGHGLPIGCGIALSRKLSKSTKRVVILVGDGEMNEGSNWESVLFAKQNNLANLYLIVDYNSSTINSTEVKNLTVVFDSLGWNSLEIDGHNINSLIEVFDLQNNNKPTAIIAKTIKGKGLKEMENNPEWHHKTPNITQLKSFIDEINKTTL